VTTHDYNTLIKFADNTMVVGLITDDDETWQNNPSLNVAKAKDLIVDYRKQRAEHALIHIDRTVVEQVKSFKFLSVQITKDLSWSKCTYTVMKRARQRLFPLRRLKGFGMGPQFLKQFYSCIIESILTGCITTWYGNCSAFDRKALQRVMYTAQYITGDELPAIQNLYARRCQRKAPKMVKDSSHQVIDCSLCYRTASSTGAPSLGPKGS
jgi:hypothetical protein